MKKYLCYWYAFFPLNMKTSCMGKVWFLSFAQKIILAIQIAQVFNIEFLKNGLNV